MENGTFEPQECKTNGDHLIVKIRESQKRSDYLSWDEYFMAVAFLSAQRSKDPRTQVGACIVNNENKIVGIGYNGMPMGCCDDVMPWGRDSEDVLDNKYLYVCHAEMNAIINKNAVEIVNCRIYVALFPCNECAKLIIQSGIKEVIYRSDKYAEKKQFQASRRMLQAAGIKVRAFESKRRQVLIDFNSLEPKVSSNVQPQDSVSGTASSQDSSSEAVASQDSASEVAYKIQHLHVSSEGASSH